MEDTIKKGDIIIVDKVFSKFTFINRGDVIVFKDYANNCFVKRCVGKAGDLVSLENGKIFIDNKLEKEPLSVKMNYQIKVKNNVWFYEILDSLNIKSNIYPSTKNTFEGILNNKDKIKLQNTSKIVSINRIPSLLSKEKLFFNSNKHSRSKDSIGDIKIPKKGMKLLLDKNTHDYYIKTINQYEGVTAINKDNQYVINGFKVENYTFKNDYIFVLGDNRDDSLDSRFKGFIPHYLIVGRVNIVF
jgi:signal peptidase I